MSQTFLITGASRGLGLETVRQLSDRNVTIIAACRNPSTAKNLIELQKASAGKVKIVELDVDNDASIQNAVAEITKLAPNGVDILINNAGVMPEPEETFETTRGNLVNTFNTNVGGAMVVVERVLPLLRKGSRKTIVNVSSALGSNAISDTRLFDGVTLGYRVSKAGLNMLSSLHANSLRNEGFIVIAIHPGWVQTDMGGESAPLIPETSIKGVLSVIDGLKTSDNGKFFNYDGSNIDW